MYNPQEISSKIVEIIESSPDKTALGVRLGLQVRSFFPGFQAVDYQARNLRDFIRMYVPRVSESGRSGQDVVYTTESPIAAQASGSALQPPAPAPAKAHAPDFVPLPTNGYCWKAYSNPSHPFVLAANRETGDLRVTPEGTAMPAPWVVVPKPPEPFHRETATEFVSTLQEPGKTTLARVLSDKKWYVRFSSVAKSASVGPQWSAFRRMRLIERFNADLRRLEIPHPPRPNRQPVAAGSLASVAENVHLQRSSLGEETMLRSLVQRAIAEMPVSELRLLRLPVGVVFDALQR